MLKGTFVAKESVACLTDHLSNKPNGEAEQAARNMVLVLPPAISVMPKKGTECDFLKCVVSFIGRRLKYSLNNDTASTAAQVSKADRI